MPLQQSIQHLWPIAKIRRLQPFNGQTNINQVAATGQVEHPKCPGDGQSLLGRDSSGFSLVDKHQIGAHDLCQRKSRPLSKMERCRGRVGHDGGRSNSKPFGRRTGPGAQFVRSAGVAEFRVNLCWQINRTEEVIQQ